MVQGDITDESNVREAIGDARVVFHLAAQLGKWGVHASEYDRINVDGTRILLQEASKARIDHFVHVSTAGVLGRLKHVPADESHPCHPENLYTRSKHKAELLVTQAIEETGFPASIIRPSHVYGPGDPNTVKLLQKMRQLPVFPLFGNGKNLFQPLYVTDLVQMLVLCVNAKGRAVGQTYQVSGDDVVTIKEFVDLSARIMGIRVKTMCVPYFMVTGVAATAEMMGRIVGREPPLIRSRVEFLGRDQAYSISKARRDVGFNPKISISEGMATTIAWYKNRGIL